MSASFSIQHHFNDSRCALLPAAFVGSRIFGAARVSVTVAGRGYVGARPCVVLRSASTAIDSRAVVIATGRLAINSRFPSPIVDPTSVTKRLSTLSSAIALPSGS